jgi:hypothetical protein
MRVGSIAPATAAPALCRKNCRRENCIVFIFAAFI